MANATARAVNGVRWSMDASASVKTSLLMTLAQRFKDEAMRVYRGWGGSDVNNAMVDDASRAMPAQDEREMPRGMWRSNKLRMKR